MGVARVVGCHFISAYVVLCAICLCFFSLCQHIRSKEIYSCVCLFKNRDIVLNIVSLSFSLSPREFCSALEFLQLLERCTEDPPSSAPSFPAPANHSSTPGSHRPITRHRIALHRMGGPVSFSIISSLAAGIYVGFVLRFLNDLIDQ